MIYQRVLRRVRGRRGARQGLGVGGVWRGEVVVPVWHGLSSHWEERKRGRRLLLVRIAWICPHVGKRV